MNKKADERILSIYLFIIYIIVAIGVVSGVIIFYGSPLDVREIEASLLSDSIIDCLTEHGEIRKEFFNDNFDLLKACHLNFLDNTQKYQGEAQYGVSVKAYSLDSCRNDLDLMRQVCTNLLKSGSWGRTDFLELCGSKGDRIPKCSIHQVYALNDGNKIVLEVTSAIGKVQNIQKS